MAPTNSGVTGSTYKSIFERTAYAGKLFEIAGRVATQGTPLLNINPRHAVDQFEGVEEVHCILFPMCLSTKILN